MNDQITHESKSTSEGLEQRQLIETKYVAMKEAIRSRDIHLIDRILCKGVDLDSDFEQDPPFFWSLFFESIVNANTDIGIDILTRLIRHGVEVDGHSQARVSPILLAIENDLPEALRLLLAAGADPCSDKYRILPLYYCIEKANVRCARTLLTCGASKCVDMIGAASDFTPLCKAAYDFHLPLICLLIDSGASRTVMSLDGKYPFEYLPDRTDANNEDFDQAYKILKID